MCIRDRIPIGAGLGGGSSDAAAALAGLSRVWGLRLPLRRLEELAAEVGSDVPFFLRGGTQLVRGRGERLRPLPSALALPVLIAYPSLFISTASIYSSGNFALTAERPLPRLRTCDLTTLSGAYRCLRGLRNDLEPVVTARHGRVARLLAELRAFHPAVVRVTGSGSSVFVMDEDERLLSRILREASVGDCRVYATRFARRGLVSVVPRPAGNDI
ncbi:MAG: hypothetical protein QUU85_07425 [Candidatus Eisenbacteria bacterium]|nr:hypothetical protein [Candidatus Eisenbacteria bacterium]